MNVPQCLQPPTVMPKQLVDREAEVGETKSEDRDVDGVECGMFSLLKNSARTIGKKHTPTQDGANHVARGDSAAILRQKDRSDDQTELGLTETDGSQSTSQKEPDPQVEHLGDSRQYWRDIILGVNDGLVSTFLLVAGVTGANLSNTDVLLTAVAGTIAGAISMAAGEYIATKTQEEVFDGEITVERRHIQQHKEAELAELAECFEKIGIVWSDFSDYDEVEDLHRRLLEFYRKRDEAHLAAHTALEFGVLEEEKRNPFIAGGFAFCLFIVGALPSVIPFLFTRSGNAAFLFAGVLTTIGLLVVGAVKTWATRGNLLVAAVENLVVSAGGGAGVGVAVEKLLRDTPPV